MLFISHSSKDKNEVNEIVTKLNVSKLPIWICDDDISSGADYTKEIPKAIRNSNAIVFVMSQNSVASKHVLKELGLALKYNKPIFPINIDGCETTEDTEYFFVDTQIFYKKDKDINQFISDIKNKLRPPRDNTLNLSKTNIKTFAIQHFKAMKYKISLGDWEKNKQVDKFCKNHPNLKDELIKYLCENCFWASKGKTELIISPHFLSWATISYFKGFEGELYWDIANFIKPDFVKNNDVLLREKSAFANSLRNNGSQKELKITFYLFIKTPPIFESKKYPLPFFKKYGEKEQLPNLFINNSIMPQWIDIDSAETINSDIFKGFKAAYETIKTDEDVELENIEYEQYNGRIAETMAATFLKRNGLLVQRFGIENTLGNSLSFVKRAISLEDSDAIDSIKEFMSSPDLLVIKLNTKNEIVNSFMMDVKWREFKNKSDLIDSLSNGDLNFQAKKYSRYWERSFLFLFAIFKETKEIKIYIINAKDTAQEPIELKKDTRFIWLDENEIEILYKEATKYWIN